MRLKYLQFSLALLFELLILSCASRNPQQVARGILPKPLAQLRPNANSPLHLQPPATPAPSTAILPDLIASPSSNAEAADGDEDRPDGPDQAEEFLRRMRLPGGGPIDPQRYLSARRHAESMRHFSIATGRFVTGRGGLKANSLAAPRDLTGGWMSLGPGNVGGRTRSLVINPQNPSIMYAGSVAGGVWKSVDAEATWAPLTDLIPTDYIGILALSPTDPNTIYAGTGEPYFSSDARRGFGILKSTDGGANWTRLPAAMDSNFYYVSKIVVTSSGNIYATTYTGVFRSSDGGDTWTQAFAQTYCYEMAARSDQPGYLFVNCSTTDSRVGPFAIFRNSDAAGAGTWDNVFSLKNMARTSLAVAPSQPTTVYAMSWSTDPQPTGMTGLVGLFRSLSSGDPDSWTTQTSNQDSNRLNTALLSEPQGLFADVCRNATPTYSGQGWFDNVLAVDPTNPDRVWAGGTDIFRSDDGGANWGLASYWNRSGTEYAHSDRHAILFHPAFDGVANQTLYIGTDGGLFRTDNANAAVQTGPRAECSPNKSDVVWVNLNHGYAVTEFYHGAVYPGAAAYFGGAQDNGTPRGSDATGADGWNYVSGEMEAGSPSALRIPIRFTTSM